MQRFKARAEYYNSEVTFITLLGYYSRAKARAKKTQSSVTIADANEAIKKRLLNKLMIVSKKFKT